MPRKNTVRVKETCPVITCCNGTIHHTATDGSGVVLRQWTSSCTRCGGRGEITVTREVADD